MADSQTPPQIFDSGLQRLRRQRALRRTPITFLLERCIEDCAERILDVNRVFERTLLIAPPQASQYLLDHLPEDRRPKSVQTAWFVGQALSPDIMLADETLPFEPGKFDLVISLLNLQGVNDLPGVLLQAKRILMPDGLFMGALFGGDTLSRFRQALYQADQALLGGVTARVSPFPDYQQLAGLLQRAGFAQPVVDRDKVNVSYEHLSGLVRDLRDMGETNVLLARNKSFLPKAFPAFLEGFLKNEAGADERRFQVCFEILWMTGWSPHHSQQKPLQPGSAQISLTEVIGKK